MQRRLARQQDGLREVKEKLGLVQPPNFPQKDRSPGKPEPDYPEEDDLETAIEIDDTPLQADENVLDVKIQRGELDEGLIMSLLANMGFG